MIVAIDIGGTKTKVIAADNSGNIVFQDVIRGFGLAVDQADKPIEELVFCIKRIPSYNTVERFVVNLGGRNANQVKNTLLSVCPDAQVDVFRESTGIIGDVIRKKAKADVIIFAGTGSIALGHGENGYFISDGWGRDIGDVGSGYFIGLEAVKTSLRAVEENEISPFITAIIGESNTLACTQCPDGLVNIRDKIRANLLPLDRDKTAAYTRITAQYAKMGDSFAREIFEQAGRGLADTAIRVCRKIGKEEEVAVAVCGGIANTRELWERTFKEQFSSFADHFELIFPETDFAQGALLYALNTRISKQ